MRLVLIQSLDLELTLRSIVQLWIQLVAQTILKRLNQRLTFIGEIMLSGINLRKTRFGVYLDVLSVILARFSGFKYTHQIPLP